MVTENKLGTENNPDIVDQSKSIDIPQDTPTFDEQLLDSLEVTITDNEIILDEAQTMEEELLFDSNLADYLDDNTLGLLSNKLMGDINSDKESIVWSVV